MQSSRPLFVIVSGAPGSGKTTLAGRLAADTDLTLLSKDALKEALSDALGHPETVAASSLLGVGAYAAMFAMTRALLATGAGVAVESNFRRGLSEPELTEASHEADVRVIHCVAEPVTINRRYGDRAVERHAAHLDAARHQDVMRELLDGRYEALEIDAPLLIVRTDEGYEPPYEEVRTFAGRGAPA
jgi:predicted kinase